MGLDWPGGGGGGGGIADLTVEEKIITATGVVDLVLDDLQKIIRFNPGADATYKINENTTLAVPLNSWIMLYNVSAFNISIGKAGPVTYEGLFGNNIFKLDGLAGFPVMLRKRLTDNWVYSGPIKAF